MSRYSNLFHMYEQATGDDPLTTPMRIAPGAHFAMGGLWSDYDLMTSVPGLFVGGEVGWGYHGANRLGANSLLSACVDGWFTLPYAVPGYRRRCWGRRCCRRTTTRCSTRSSPCGPAPSGC